MARVFTRRYTVPADAIDANGHMNNVAYLRWMQEVAIAHSAAVGWPMERYFATGATWVARSHFIEYLRPAFEGDPVAVHTWIGGMSHRSSPRRYLFERESDTRALARAETMWVYVETESGRPVRIPEEMMDAFPIVPDDEAVARELGRERLR